MEFKEPTRQEWNLETENLSKIIDLIIEIKNNHQNNYFKGFYGAIHTIIVTMVTIYSLADDFDKGVVSIALKNITEIGKEYTRVLISKLN